MGQAKALVFDGYVLLRTATHGIGMAMDKSENQGAFLRVYRENIIKVRDLLRLCMDELDRSINGNYEKVGSAKKKLENAILYHKMLIQ
jgi:hypothetical protein